MQIFKALLVFLLAQPLMANPDNDWMKYWDKIPTSQLPSLVPDGDFSLYRLALERQKENCQDFKDGRFRHCGHESSHVELQCDDAVIDKLLQFVKSSNNWTSFFSKARTSFEWYRYKGDKPNTRVLFTGYNAPLFSGTLTPDAKHQYPVYRRPPDLVDLKAADGTIMWRKRMPDGSLGPYDDRKTIDIDKILAGKNLEVAYFEYPSDILRLQIEGSGILEVTQPDGTKKQYGMNYAGKNGLQFVSVFNYLRAKGVDRKYMTFPGLKQYFIDFPHDMWPTLITNPSYVFFAVGNEPPCSTARAHLTGGHSLAVDPTHLPLGSMAFLNATRPVEGSDPNSGSVPMKPFSRFAVAVDTGGPIKGAHVDIYFGSDDYAQLASNVMSSRGTLYIMKLKK